MMQDALLATKLYIPPPRSESVSRTRLISQLNDSLSQHQGSGRKLTLISAPAGFGKTTLVSEWIDSLHSTAKSDGQAGYEIAWLSLDKNDNDPARFLAYFIAALNKTDRGDGPIGQRSLTMIQSPQPLPLEAILTSLINEIAVFPGRMIIVLDDYHLAGSPPVDNALTFLLDHLPPQLHLVIATREDPHLPLARLRGRDQLTELRAADLRFTSSETTEFLNQVMDLNLSAEDVSTLETRTEGWIVGLRLAAISMRGHQDIGEFVNSFAGSHRFVLDYLIEEILQHQTADIQDFLLQTAILDRLTAPLCDVLVGQDDSQTTLEMLERANLFIIPLDDERCWYRYHHLFADLLNERLHQTHPELIAVLHYRASEWFEQHDLTNEAIEHALHAEDFECAARLIARQADAIWESGEHAIYRLWLDRLPIEFVFSEPILCTLHAETQFTRGQMNEAVLGLETAEQILAHVTDAKNEQPGTDRLKLLGRIAADKSQIAAWRGDVPSTLQYARQALDLLPENALPWRSVAAITLGDAHSINGEIGEAYQAQLEAREICRAAGITFLLLIANVNLAVTQRQRGHLQQAIDTCQELLQLANENGMSHTIVVGWCLTIWAEMLAEVNDLDGAIEKASQGVEIAERYGDVGMLSKSYLCLIRILFSKGDMSNAEEIIRKLENIARGANMPPGVPSMIAAWQARIWLAQGSLDLKARWANDRRLSINEDLTYLREPEHIALARILIDQKQLEDAIGLLHQLEDLAQAGGRTSTTIEILLLQALAFQADGNTAEAISELEHALTLAEPGGFVRIFVDEGPPMARLLYDSLRHGNHADYKHQLLAAFPATESAQVDLSKSQSPESNIIEPLTEREIEVLGLMAEGLSNREIADRLILSLHTIKAHSRNIYGKLDVHSRMSAVTKAKALGVLGLDN